MNLIVIGIITSCVFYAIAFISLNNPIIAVLPALLSLVYFVFVADPQYKKYKNKIQSFNKSYVFINNFIVSLSINPVIDSAFDHAVQTLDEEFVSKIGDIKQLNGNEKIRYMSNYFPFHAYNIFIDLIEMWQEQGGDILKMSSNLSNQLTEINETILVTNQMKSKKIVEFVILWAFSLAILVVLRFALSQFYDSLASNIIFKVGVLSIFVLVIISVQLLLSKITKFQIRGWNKNGK